MKKIILYFLLTTSYFLLSTTCLSLESPFWNKKGRAGYPGEYLTTFTANARAAALANTYTALSEDSSGPYWNPAGLARVYAIEVSFLYTQLFFHTDYGFLGLAYPLTVKDVFGLSLIALQSANAQETYAHGGTGGKFNELESAFLITYARRLNQSFDLGMNLKIVRQEIADFSDGGVGFDLGLKYHLASGQVYGLNLQNFLPPKLQLREAKEIYPLNTKLGVVFPYLKGHLLWASDLVLIDPLGKYKSLYWSTGLEYKIHPHLSFRGGVSYKEISAGFGLVTHNFNFDYAVSLHRINLTHRCGVSYRYGFLSAEEERRLKEEKDVWQKEMKAYRETLDQEKKTISEEQERVAKQQKIAAGLILAKTYLEEKNYPQAKKELEKILYLEPENKEIKNLLAEINQLQNRELAEKSYLLAKDFYERKFYLRSLEVVKKTLEYWPEYEKAKILSHLSQGQVYIGEKKYLEAREEFFAVLKLEPQHEEALTLLKRLQTILELYPTKGE